MNSMRPLRIGGARGLVRASGGMRYLLRDFFPDDHAAGAVNGTLAQPGGYGTSAQLTRTVNAGIASKVSITGGQLVFSGGNNAYTQPVRYGAFTRVAERVCQFDVTLPATNQTMRLGWSIDGSDSNTRGGILQWAADANIYLRIDAATADLLVAYQATTYSVRLVLKAAGCEVYIKGGIWTDWTKIALCTDGAQATLYPTIFNYSAAPSFDNVMIYDRKDYTPYLYGAKVGGFVKQGEVLPQRATKWDSRVVREINIVLDENGNKVVSGGLITSHYWGSNVGGGATGNAIGIATSNDNGLTWGGRQDTPLISPSGVPGSWYENTLFQASTIKRADGLFMMLAIGNNANLGLFTSPDGTTWTDGGKKLDGSSFYGGNAIAAPSVIKRSLTGDYICLMEAYDATLGWYIIGATSPDFVGTWTPLNGGNPLMTKNTSIWWKALGVSNPHAAEILPGVFLVAYTGFTTLGLRQVGFATTADFVTFQDYSDNIVLSRTASAWDSQSVESSFLDKDDYPNIRLYYHGFETGWDDIAVGLAITTV